MSYEILGTSGKYWTCPQHAWRDYIKLATAFGWAPEGAFFKCDEAGFGEHPSGSYIGNDWQIVTDDDARAMAAALNLAVATINAGSPMTDNQAAALKPFEIGYSDPFKEIELTETQRAGLLRPDDGVRTIRTRSGTFDVNVRRMMDLADAVSVGFTVA